MPTKPKKTKKKRPAAKRAASVRGQKKTATRRASKAKAAKKPTVQIQRTFTVRGAIVRKGGPGWGPDEGSIGDLFTFSREIDPGQWACPEFDTFSSVPGVCPNHGLQYIRLKLLSQ